MTSPDRPTTHLRNENRLGRPAVPGWTPAGGRLARLPRWSRLLLGLAILIGIGTLVGCGGGGGGSDPGLSGTSSGQSNTPVGPEAGVTYTPLPNLAVGNLTTIPSIAAQPGSILQTPLRTEEHALIVTTAPVGTRESEYRLVGNGGTITNLPSIRSDEAPTASVRGGLRAPAQALGDREMRQRSRQHRPVDRSSVRATRRATVENVGDIITLWVYSQSVSWGGGQKYTQRRGQIKKIGAHCKILVDPDPSANGLSAASGPSAITQEHIDQFADRFDNVIYSLITTGYGNTFDKDGDGKVTIYFSPHYNNLGFAGLFDSVHLYTRGAAGVLDSQYSNERDMFVIMCPDVTGIEGSTWSHTRWFSAAAETIAHEFQHLVNHATRRLEHDWPEEHEWLDEALSMGAELRYRRLIGDPATEDRFGYWANNPDYYSLTNFAWNLGNYGMVGLFAHFLLEQGGPDAIRGLVQTNRVGIQNIDGQFAARGGFNGMFQDWSVAIFAEGNKSWFDRNLLPTRQRYAEDMGINLVPQTGRINYAYPFSGYMKGAGVRFIRLQPYTGYTTAQAILTLRDPDSGGMRATILRTR